jgi:hypothetical protein
MREKLLEILERLDLRFNLKRNRLDIGFKILHLVWSIGIFFIGQFKGLYRSIQRFDIKERSDIAV